MKLSSSSDLTLVYASWIKSNWNAMPLLSVACKCGYSISGFGIVSFGYFICFLLHWILNLYYVFICVMWSWWLHGVHVFVCSDHDCVIASTCVLNCAWLWNMCVVANYVHRYDDFWNCGGLDD